MGIRCVAFDLDGVVISSDPSFHYFQTQHGITRAQFLEFFRGRGYRQTITGEAKLLDVLPETLRAWGWTDTTEAFTKTWMESCADCNPAVCDIIVALRETGIECCLATNQDDCRGAFLEALPALRELFTPRFYSYELKVAKPDSAYFEAISQRLGRNPAEMLFVDDKSENVAAARHCGWQAEVCTSAESVLRALRVHLPEFSLG